MEALPTSLPTSQLTNPPTRRSPPNRHTNDPHPKHKPNLSHRQNPRPQHGGNGRAGEINSWQSNKMRPGSRMVPRRRQNHRNHGTHPHRPHRRLMCPRCRRRSPERKLGSGLGQRRCLELRPVSRCRLRPREHPSLLSSGNQWFLRRRWVPRVRCRPERRRPLRRWPLRLRHPRPPHGHPRMRPPPPAPPLIAVAALVPAPATIHPTVVPTTSTISLASPTGLVMRRPR